MAEFGKMNFSVAFNPTSAFPLDARCYFTSLADAKAAAATAEEVGSTNSVYYYGQKVVVVDGDSATWYTIQPNKTLKEDGAGGGGGSDGTTDHSALTNRDAADSHPMAAITGLSSKIADVDRDLDTKLGEDDAMSYADIYDIISK